MDFKKPRRRRLTCAANDDADHEDDGRPKRKSAAPKKIGERADEGGDDCERDEIAERDPRYGISDNGRMQSLCKGFYNLPNVSISAANVLLNESDNATCIKILGGCNSRQ